MSSYDAGYDAEIKRRQQVADGAQVQSIGSAVAAQKASDKSVTVFDNKNVEESAKKLGLTAEQYLEIVNNPEFTNLSSEEQLAYIDKYKAAHKVSGSQAAQPDVAVKPEEQVVNTPTVNLDDYYEEVSETNTGYTTDTDCIAHSNVGDAFDYAAYSKKDTKEMFRIYTKEYAKNKYISDKIDELISQRLKEANLDGEKLSREQWRQRADLIKEANYEFDKFRVEWDKLSDDEKAPLIVDAKKEVKDKFGINTEEDLNKKGMDAKFAREMFSLQTANYHQVTLKIFDSFCVERQDAMKMETLSFLKGSGLEELFSDGQKKQFQLQELTVSAVCEELKRRGVDEGVCVDNLPLVLKKHNINLPEVMQQYLEQEEKNGRLDDNSYGKLYLQSLRENSGKAFISKMGARCGSLTRAEMSVAEDQDFAKLLANIEQRIKVAQEEDFNRVYQLEKRKNDLIIQHVIKNFTNDPLTYKDFITDAYECGNKDLVIGLMKHAMNVPEIRDILYNDPEYKEALAYFGIQAIDESTSGTGVEKTTEAFGNATATVTGGLSKQDAKKVVAAAADVVKNALIRGASTASVVTGLNKSGNEELTNKVTDAVNEGTDAKTVKKYHESVNECGSEESKDYAAVTVDKAPENVQAEVVGIYSNGNGRRTQLMIASGVVPKCGPSAQSDVFDILKNNAENLLPKDEAIKTLNTLSDQIADCDVSNQLGMHKSMMGSKYEEVQTHTAGNVYKYDKSVQAEAIKVVYETGNVAAIEAVNTQLSKCDPAAVQSIAKEVAAQVAAMEERHSKTVSANIAEKAVLMEAAANPKDSAGWSAEDRNAKLAQYREQFTKATPLEKFRMMTKLQGVWQKEVITHIATYCPELLSSLISSMGADLFQLQLTPEVKNKIMLEMLRVPDMQADALEFFKDNPNGFSANVKTTCAELLVERDDSALKSQTIRYALPASFSYATEPDTLFSGGKVSNREYYSGDIKTFWKRDKLGRLMG